MARPIKKGLDYFPADVDMFQDRKIKRLLRAVGGKGFTTFVYLLTIIYRDEGYYYEWDKHSAFDISDDLNFSESVVEETVKACCAIGLFHEGLYTTESVLTSESIQNRWQKIVRDANRSDTSIDPRLEIIDGVSSFLTKKTGLTTEETPQKSRESTQSKEKESKEKESREPTARSVSNFSFSDFWELYGKPIDEKRCKTMWMNLSEDEKKKVMEFIPHYKTYEPNVKFRKDPANFLAERFWKSEFIVDAAKHQKKNGHTPQKGLYTQPEAFAWMQKKRIDVSQLDDYFKLTDQKKGEMALWEPKT